MTILFLVSEIMERTFDIVLGAVHEYGIRPATRTKRRRSVKRKTLALLRWLRRFSWEPGDGGEQWWHEFDTVS